MKQIEQPPIPTIGQPYTSNFTLTDNVTKWNLYTNSGNLIAIFNIDNLNLTGIEVNYTEKYCFFVSEILDTAFLMLYLPPLGWSSISLSLNTSTCQINDLGGWWHTGEIAYISDEERLLYFIYDFNPLLYDIPSSGYYRFSIDNGLEFVASPDVDSPLLLDPRTNQFIQYYNTGPVLHIINYEAGQNITRRYINFGDEISSISDPASINWNFFILLPPVLVISSLSIIVHKKNRNKSSS
ncbi:MAG: hypothetical protein EAX86_10500 [Candidatus Heimdallarchaeota archaeon]|nr:hypothetical protein [Candidatus Heimdallarchaeota archaeon]